MVALKVLSDKILRVVCDMITESSNPHDFAMPTSQKIRAHFN